MATCPICHEKCTMAYYDKDYNHKACNQCITPEKMKTCDVCGEKASMCYYDKNGNKLGCRKCMHIHVATSRDEFADPAVNRDTE